MSWKGSIETKLGIFLIGGGGSSYQEGGGGSGYIKYASYTTNSQSEYIYFYVGRGGCKGDENGHPSGVTFPDGTQFMADGGGGGGTDGDAGCDGWSGGGGDDGGKGGSNGNNGKSGQYGDRGGYGKHEGLPQMKFMTLSPGAGGRGGSILSSSYDGGGGGGVLVYGAGPSIRRDGYNRESGQGYGAGGSYGYNGGIQECGTDGLIIVGVLKYPGIFLYVSFVVLTCQ